MKFDAYKGRDLQTAMSILEQARGQSVDTVLSDLQKVIDRRFPAGKVALKKPTRPKQPHCPSCGMGSLYGPYKVDGLIIQRCSRKCGYSEVIG